LPPSTSFCPYTTLFRSEAFLDDSESFVAGLDGPVDAVEDLGEFGVVVGDLLESELLAFVGGLVPDGERDCDAGDDAPAPDGEGRSEEHTSELQSRENLV